MSHRNLVYHITRVNETALVLYNTRVHKIYNLDIKRCETKVCKYIKYQNYYTVQKKYNSVKET